MERQIYPTSKIKLGAVLYGAMGYEWEGRIILDVNEWVVRSIQKKRGSQTRYGRVLSQAFRNDDVYVNITEKVKDITWGKRSKKNGDYGWLSSISQQHRQSFKVGERLPYGILVIDEAQLLCRESDWNNFINVTKSHGMKVLVVAQEASDLPQAFLTSPDENLFINNCC